MTDLIKQELINKYLTCPKGWLKWLTAAKNKELLQALLIEYPLANTIAEKMYWLVNNLTDFPVCPTCGKKLTLFGKHRTANGARFCYATHCNSKCAALDPNTKALRDNTKEVRYGNKNYNNAEKTTATCLAKYGTGRNNAAIEQTMLTRYGVASFLSTKEIADSRNSKEIQEKIQKTKRINNTFNSSKAEEAYYEQLCNKYGTDAVVRQYKEERYPFNCDFYIKTEDLFIELNLNWTHGSHPFDEDNEQDLKRLAVLKEKAQFSKFYRNALAVWTVRDVKKLKIAQKNKLKYLRIYKDGEFYEEN